MPGTIYCNFYCVVCVTGHQAKAYLDPGGHLRDKFTTVCHHCFLVLLRHSLKFDEDVNLIGDVTYYKRYVSSRTKLHSFCTNLKRKMTFGEWSNAEDYNALKIYDEQKKWLRNLRLPV